jgi:hypothetical protein
MIHKFGFVFVMEQGDLEAQTTLLVESIRRLASLRDSPIVVVQPRRGPPPSPASLSLLAENHVEFISGDFNQAWRRHGPMNKAFASALAEAELEQSVETLVFLDSDTLFVSEPDGLELTGPHVAGATPIAVWRVGRVGQLRDEPLTPYWKLLYENCGVTEIPNWHVTTTLDQRQMLPYFNSGVVATRPSYGIFRKWKANAERLALNPTAQNFHSESREFFFLDQTVLAATLVAELSQEQFRVQSHRFNYPLALHQVLPEGIRAVTLDDITIVHYHKAFWNLYWKDKIELLEPLSPWLSSRLPLRPKARWRRPSILLLTSHLLSKLPFRRQHRRILRHIPGLRRTVDFVKEPPANT